MLVVSGNDHAPDSEEEVKSSLIVSVVAKTNCPALVFLFRKFMKKKEREREGEGEISSRENLLNYLVRSKTFGLVRNLL